jgi:hypothetical protein
LEPSCLDDSPEARELFSALDDEIARLPESFRVVVLLCDLGGLTHESAAQRIGCPIGTLESRLARARNRLRKRLTGRGLAPSAVAPILKGLALPRLPEALSLSTVGAATARGVVRATVLPLVQGVLTDMAWIKVKTLTLGFGAIVLACGLGVAAERKYRSVDRPRHEVTAEESDEPIVLQPPAKLRPGDTIIVEVLEALPGRPISGERVVKPDGTISLGFYGDIPVAGLNRHEIKVKVIEQLLKFLPDEILGLEVQAPNSKKMLKVAPADSDRVFVDETFYVGRHRRASASDDRQEQYDEVLRKLEELTKEVEALKGRATGGRRMPGR